MLWKRSDIQNFSILLLLLRFRFLSEREEKSEKNVFPSLISTVKKKRKKRRKTTGGSVVTVIASGPRIKLCQKCQHNRRSSLLCVYVCAMFETRITIYSSCRLVEGYLYSSRQSVRAGGYSFLPSLSLSYSSPYFLSLLFHRDDSIATYHSQRYNSKE